jgi:hypothetical protein
VHRDPLVRRIGQLSVVICVVSAVAALIAFGWRPAAGVLGGGLLIGISFYSIGGGVAAIVAAASGGRPARRVLIRTLVILVIRYALLGFLAYVMIARLRLHPIGLLVGASSVAAAAFVEAFRHLAKKP